jgi:hypothetical protein
MMGNGSGKKVKVTRPNKFRVGSRVYAIKWDEESLEMAKFKGDDTGLWGCTDHASLTTYISPQVDQYNQRVTLLHEVLHCLFHTTGADVRNAVLVKDEDFNVEEYIICRLEEPMMSFMIDNPEVFAYLVVGEHG